MAFFDFVGRFESMNGRKLAVRAEHRLKLNREFRRVFSRGRSKATNRLVLYWWEKRVGGYRVGFSVSKKVGNAVVRNRLKRQLRACFDQYDADLEDRNVDFVVVCRQGAADTSFSELNSDLVKLLRRGKFMV